MRAHGGHAALRSASPGLGPALLLLNSTPRPPDILAAELAGAGRPRSSFLTTTALFPRISCPRLGPAPRSRPRSACPNKAGATREGLESPWEPASGPAAPAGLTLRGFPLPSPGRSCGTPRRHVLAAPHCPLRRTSPRRGPPYLGRTRAQGERRARPGLELELGQDLRLGQELGQGQD